MPIGSSVASVAKRSISMPVYASKRRISLASRLAIQLAPFDDPRGDDPGGWVILIEPELHLDDDIVVPDLAGWRRQRMPEIPTDLAYFVVAPDWCCEVLSPTTERVDRGEKAEIYAENGVGHYWLVNADLKTVEVLRLDGTTYRIVRVFREATPQRMEPFDAVEIALERLWQR
jgi:Uma2 family endonuclease